MNILLTNLTANSPRSLQLEAHIPLNHSSIILPPLADPFAVAKPNKNVNFVFHMRTLGFLLLALPNFLLAQVSVMVLPSSELESKGLSNMVSHLLPPNGVLHPIQKLNGYSVYELYFQNHPVLGMQIAIYQSQGKLLITSSMDPKIPFEKPDKTVVNSANMEWVFNDNKGQYELLRYQDSAGYRLYTHATTHEKTKVNMYRYFDTDTVVKARVFLPDPLSSANKLYGGKYRDRNDSTYAEIEAEMFEKNMVCNFSNDSFRLRNRFLSFAEVSAPKSAAAISKTPFLYFRNNQKFEEVNVFYHVNELMKWWDVLGFSAYFDTVVMDAHAYFGADESGFNPLANPPTIEFGDGGVDDAEDADVSIHEYTHCAFNHVIPKSNVGFQRQSIEEGICYFMSVAYSQRYTSNQATSVYNWDGHNAFWNGRSLDNTKKWPMNLTNQIHVDGELFGAALYDLAQEIGFDSTMVLVMEAMPLMVANMDMGVCAKLIWRMDSLFHQGRFSWPLIKAFYPRNLLPFLSVESQNKTFGLLRNTQAFAIGIGEIGLLAPENGTAIICNASGQKLISLDLTAGETYTLQPSQFKPGLYFFYWNGYSEKFLKF